MNKAHEAVVVVLAGGVLELALVFGGIHVIAAILGGVVFTVSWLLASQGDPRAGAGARVAVPVSPWRLVRKLRRRWVAC
jgi:hypothetical protein